MTRAPPQKEKTYTVRGMVTISIRTVVKATSPKAAIEAALNRPMVTLCHQCGSGDDRVEWCTSGELDGEPTDLDAGEE